MPKSHEKKKKRLLRRKKGKTMKLKDLIKEYQASKGANDFLSLYYTDEKGRRERISLDHIKAYKPESLGLLMEADLIQSRIDETEGTAVAVWGGKDAAYKCRCYSGELDADQAQIALGTHPALRKAKRSRFKL